MKRFVLNGLALLATLAGCTAPPEQRSAAEKPDAQSMEQPEETPTSESQAAQAGTMPGQQAPGPTCARTLPAPGPAAQKEMFKILMQARVLLNEGEEDKARAELDCAQQLEADNKQLVCLLRGINVDLSSAHAGDSTPYTVRQGETLGSIAQRFLGDSCEFYMLARFNKIKTPKQLPVGQTIRLPGRINVAVPPPPPPATTETRVKPVPVTPKPEPAPPPVEVVKKPEPSPEARRAEIERLYRRGVDEYRRQNLAAAISAYDAVLAIDPNHGGARFGRQQAVELQEKLRNIKK